MTNDNSVLLFTWSS